MAGPFDRFIGIDWSGASTTRGQQIFVAEAHRQGARVTLASLVRARDRAAVEAYLCGQPLQHAPAWRDWPGPGRIDGRTRRVVALDFAFGFPAAFEHPELDAAWDWEDLGRWAESLEPAAGDGNGAREPLRRAIAADPALSRQFRTGPGGAARMHRRITDDCSPARPESVFHLVGPSQVGMASITGIAMLSRLRELEHLAVWPLDSAERLEAAAVVLVEVFPRMWLLPRLQKNELPDCLRQVEAWKHQGVAFRSDAELAAAASGDALDAAAAAIGAARSCYALPAPEVVPEESRRREGWIAGVQVPS